MRVDVAIIGGGLVGSSAALALRNLGLSVVLFDAGYCGAQASGVNFGGVRRQGRQIVQLPLSQRAHAIWPNLQARIGIDGEFIRSGHLKMARSDAEMASLEAYAHNAAPHGIGLELIGRNALRERYPWISDDVVGASLCAGDGHANPRLVATGYAAAARRAGVDVRENTSVANVAATGHGFAIEAAGETLAAGTVINAAGAWAAPFAAAFNEPVPLVRTYPSMVVTEPLAPIFTVNTGVEGGKLYARQVARGNVVIGGERGLPLANTDFSRPRSDGVEAIMARAIRVFPRLRHAHAIRFWSGTEGTMPDRNPVLSPSHTTPGLIHAFGFSGAGFQISLGVGEVLAELVTTGASTTPIHAFAITRFANKDPAP